MGTSFGKFLIEQKPINEFGLDNYVLFSFVLYSNGEKVMLRSYLGSVSQPCFVIHKRWMLRPYMYGTFRVYHNSCKLENTHKDVHVKEHVAFVWQFLQSWSKLIPTYFILILSQLCINNIASIKPMKFKILFKIPDILKSLLIWNGVLML